MPKGTVKFFNKSKGGIKAAEEREVSISLAIREEGKKLISFLSISSGANCSKRFQ